MLAATQNKSTQKEDPTDPDRAEKIIAAATAGHVPVRLVGSKTSLSRFIPNYPNCSSDLSDKNPLHILPHDADLIDLLALFAEGAHKGAKSRLTVATNGRLTLASACQIIDFPNRIPRSRD